MNSDSYPLRFRLADHPRVHAVRFKTGEPPFTACGQEIVGDGGREHERTRVSCAKCRGALRLSA